MKAIPRYRKVKTNKKLHELIPNLHDHTPYIYFLIRKHKIVYIGQTHSIRYRLHHHNCYLNYDSVRWIKCEEKNLSYYERRWIKKFNPEYNTMFTRKWKWREKSFEKRAA